MKAFKTNHTIIMKTKDMRNYLEIINQVNVKYKITVSSFDSNIWSISFRANIFVKSWIDREYQKLISKDETIKEKKEES